MHRTHICTWFTCSTDVAKKAIFTGLEQSDNKNTLEHDRNTRESSSPLQVFKPNKILERSITNAFYCVVLFASNPVFRHLKILNFLFLGH